MLLKDYLQGRMQRVKVGDTSSDWQEVRQVLGIEFHC